MKCMCAQACLAVLGLLMAPSVALSRDESTVYVDGDREAVVAFLPPSMQDAQDRSAAEAQARVRSAVESVKGCLGPEVNYRVVFAERLVVRSRGGEESFEFGHLVPLTGALLLRPGSNTRILFAGGGPEALVQLLWQATGDYFGKECDGG
jgi:hypothetical protein